MEFLHQDKTERIIQAYYKVYNTLGYGFLEKVYQNAMLIELRRMGFECKSQSPIIVYYEEFPVGDYFADIIIDNCIIIENKAAQVLIEDHEFQLINYLKAQTLKLVYCSTLAKDPDSSGEFLPTTEKIRTRIIRMFD